jgi:AcrR family transcriptional regulator
MSGKGERTRELLLDVALKLFRRRGFDGTTMRDIATKADMSLGAAYHYFRSKEEIVAAYFEQVQTQHEAALPASWPESASLPERLTTIMRSKLAIVKGDRRFLAALFRFAAEPEHPLGVFSSETRDVRERAIAIFARALDGQVDASIAPWVAQALWLGHLGVLLRLQHDRSKDMAPTLALVDAAASSAADLIRVAGIPAVREMLAPTLLRLAAVASIEH